jgi:hypothetical protein
MKTVVDEFTVVARTTGSGDGIVEAWCEVPHTAEILGLSGPIGWGFGLVCRYTEDDDTPATTEKRTMYLLRNCDKLPWGAKAKYIGSWSSPSSPPLHVFEEMSK